MASQNSTTDLDGITEVDGVLSERQQNTLTVRAQILQHFQRLKHKRARVTEVSEDGEISEEKGERGRSAATNAAHSGNRRIERTY